MPLARENQAPCTVHVLENGIYQIIVHESSQNAVDTWLNYMSELTAYLEEEGGYASIVLDLREPGMIPVVYATHAVQKWAAENPNPPAIDLAVVYRYGLFYSLANALTGLSSIQDGVRLFHNGRYDEAQLWLLQRGGVQG